MTYPLFSHTCASDTQSSGKAASPLPTELPMTFLISIHSPSSSLHSSGPLKEHILENFTLELSARPTCLLIHSSFPGRAGVALPFTSFPSELLSSRPVDGAGGDQNCFLKFISNFQCLLCHRINISPAGGWTCLFFSPLQIFF